MGSILVILAYICFQDQEELAALKESIPDISLFFVRVPLPTVTPAAPDLLASLPQPGNQQVKPPVSPPTEPPTTSNTFQNGGEEIPLASLRRSKVGTIPSSDPTSRRTAVYISPNTSLSLFQQLVELAYLTLLPGSGAGDVPATETRRERLLTSSSDSDSFCDTYATESELVEDLSNLRNLLPSFTHRVLQNQLIKAASLLNVVHTRCLQMFIVMAFDMQRDMQMTPKRLEFARSKETQLYQALMDIALRKQDEIRNIIAVTIDGMREMLLDKAANYEFLGNSLNWEHYVLEQWKVFGCMHVACTMYQKFSPFGSTMIKPVSSMSST